MCSSLCANEVTEVKVVAMVAMQNAFSNFLSISPSFDLFPLLFLVHHFPSYSINWLDKSFIVITMPF